MRRARASSRTCSSVSAGFLTAPLFLRSASCRGYRLPPCALINLSHGSRADHTSHRLTAVVKPQPAAQRQLGNLNHSPRSPFIPTQVREQPEAPPSPLRYKRSELRCSAPQQHNKHGAVKSGSQGSRNSPSKGLMQKQQAKVGLSSTLLSLKDGLVLNPLFLSEQGDVQ